jgi:uncharacterized protein YukE
MNEIAWVAIIALAVFAGAAAGTYLAWQPAVQSAKTALEQTQDKAEQALANTEQNIQKATEHLAKLEIVVPEPRVSINFQWWHVFAMTLAVVLGMILSRAYDRSAVRKIVNSSVERLIKRLKPKRKRKRVRSGYGNENR